MPQTNDVLRRRFFAALPWNREDGSHSQPRRRRGDEGRTDAARPRTAEEPRATFENDLFVPYRNVQSPSDGEESLGGSYGVWIKHVLKERNGSDTTIRGGKGVIERSEFAGGILYRRGRGMILVHA